MAAHDASDQLSGHQCEIQGTETLFTAIEKLISSVESRRLVIEYSWAKKNAPVFCKFVFRSSLIPYLLPSFLLLYLSPPYCAEEAIVDAKT